MEPLPQAHIHGKKRRVSCPPPEEWEYDDHGRPTWIPLRSSGKWHPVAHRPSAVIQLPQLKREDVRHHGYGRPRLVDTDTDLGEIVWLHDLAATSYTRIADMLGHKGYDPRTTIQYRARAGRKHLAAAGVLPWAAYPNGTLPYAWWTDRTLEAAIYRWMAETLRPLSVAAELRSALAARH